MKMTLTKSFTTVSEPTDRTLLVSEAFGLGLDTKRQFPVLEGLEVDIRPSDICLIVGDSGGGKSTLLRMLSDKIRETGIYGKLLDANSIGIEDDEVLVHGAGATFEEALKNLSLAGLNDAFLFIRRFKELSDGQKHRYRLARMLASDASVWVFDEFLSTLDRGTAKAVAYCLQKNARRERKTLLVATTHEDLLDDLNPNIIVRKGFGQEAEVEYRSVIPYALHECSLTKEVEVREGNREDYDKLSAFHYRAGLPTTTRKIFSMYHRGKLIGVIAYRASPLTAAGRTKFLGYAPSPEDVNKNFLTICRVVLHPKFRGIGLGARLVKDTLPQVNRKYVEAMAVMAKYNPFFEKAAMARVEAESDVSNEAATLLAEASQITGGPIRQGNFNALMELEEEKYSELRKLLGHSTPYFVLSNIYGHQSEISNDGLIRDLMDRRFTLRLLSELAILAQDKAYYIWRNPAL